MVAILEQKHYDARSVVRRVSRIIKQADLNRSPNLPAEFWRPWIDESVASANPDWLAVINTLYLQSMESMDAQMHAPLDSTDMWTVFAPCFSRQILEQTPLNVDAQDLRLFQLPKATAQDMFEQWLN